MGTTIPSIRGPTRRIEKTTCPTPLGMATLPPKDTATEADSTLVDDDASAGDASSPTISLPAQGAQDQHTVPPRPISSWRTTIPRLAMPVVQSFLLPAQGAQDHYPGIHRCPGHYYYRQGCLNRNQWTSRPNRMLPCNPGNKGYP